MYRSEPDLKKYSEYAITYHSTAIEGSSLTETEVIELLDIGKPANKKEFADNVHFHFVSIHPFRDGNGRVSRLLMNYILACYNFPMFFVFKENRIKYIDALCEAQETEDVTPFYEFMYKQYIKFFKHEIKEFS